MPGRSFDGDLLTPEEFKLKVISDKNKKLVDAQRLLQNISNSNYDELINMNRSNRSVKLQNLDTLIDGFRIAIERNQDITTEIVNEQLRYIVPRGKFTDLMNILKSKSSFPLTLIEALKIKGLRCAREFLYKTATECETDDRLAKKERLGNLYDESRNKGGKSRKTRKTRKTRKSRKTRKTRK